MKNVLEEIDKILGEVEQGGAVAESQNRVDLLKELIKRAQERQIILTARNRFGVKERLRLTSTGVSVWDRDRYTYRQVIDLSGNIKNWSDSPKSMANILQKALLGEVKIEII